MLRFALCCMARSLARILMWFLGRVGFMDIPEAF